MINKLTSILTKYFNGPIMKGLAYVIVSLIKENWETINKYTSVRQVGQYLLNKLFRGSGDLILGKK